MANEASEFERIMAAHERLVLGTAYRLLGRMEDAQDAAQEVFLRLFKNLGRVGDDPKPWLYRVTVNLCNDYYRRRTLVAEPDERRADPAPDPLSLLTMDERKRLLMEGLQTSPRCQISSASTSAAETCAGRRSWVSEMTAMRWPIFNSDYCDSWLRAV